MVAQLCKLLDAEGAKNIRILMYCYILTLKRENLSLMMVLSLEEEKERMNLISCLNQEVGTHG